MEKRCKLSRACTLTIGVSILVLSLFCFLVKTGKPQGASKSVVVGQGIDIVSLDPYGYSMAGGYAVWKHINQTLVKYDFRTKKYAGVLAESWKCEGNEWTFNLRKGVKFHNGADFTANDVVASYEAIIASKQQMIQVAPIKTVKVVDSHTVKLITEEPNAPLISRIKDWVMISQQVYKQYGKDAINHPTGTGPFKFVEWTRGSYFVAKRNEAYWGTPAKIDQVIWKPIPEDAARITALESGEIDIATGVPPHEVGRLEKNPKIRFEKVRALRTLAIGLSPRFKPFSNRLVRQAMNYAVDVDALVTHVLEGRAYRANGPIGPDHVGYSPEVKPYSYDLAKARSLLAQAGYPNGFEVDYYSPSGRYVKDREIAQAIGAQLVKVGVKVNVKLPEYSVFWDGVLQGKWDMFIYGGFNYEDPDLFLGVYFETGGTKRLGYSNPELDKLIRGQRLESDFDKRNKILRDIMILIHDDAPVVPLFHYQENFGVNKRIVWNAFPDEEVALQEASIQ